MTEFTDREPLLKVRRLRKHFPSRRSMFIRQREEIRAVSDVSFDIAPGETLGLVGESGCGKSTTGRMILRLIEPTSGEIWFGGHNVLALRKSALRDLRKDIQIIFQDPYSSLDPKMTVAETLGEVMAVHGLARGRKDRDARSVAILETVGLSADHLYRYPHEFSGGQRQRIGIARALLVNPKLIVCDEAVSALDVSVQAQVLNLLQDLQAKFGLTYLFIGHDLSVVQYISSRIAVMYMGRIVEIARSRDLYQNPRHPYTKALLSAVPVPDPLQKRARNLIAGDVVPSDSLPAGCAFYLRCPSRVASCAETEQTLLQVSPNHWVACQVSTGPTGRV